MLKLGRHPPHKKQSSWTILRSDRRKSLMIEYTPISIRVALGFGHWNAEYNAMLCLSDHQTMAFKDQSTIPKATFIEIGVYTCVGHLSLKVWLGQACVELHNGAVLRLLPPFFFMTSYEVMRGTGYNSPPPNQSHNAFQQKQRSSPAHAQTLQ